jgi:hypothetical protein
MPSPTYQQNKAHIYKWRQQNADRNRELNLIARRRCDAWKKIAKTFLGILI